MGGMMIKLARASACAIAVALLASSIAVSAQVQKADPPSPQNSPLPAPGWHAFSRQAQAADPPSQNVSPTPDASQNPAVNSPAGNDSGLPGRLVIQRGAYITVRIDQMLSSKRSRAGDAFTATLVKPIVVNGLVVAQRGQTAGGQVVEAKKSGRVKGVAQLAVQLTGLTMVDGQQMAVQTQLIGEKAPTSRGRDAGGLAATTALGAAIGGASSGGIGAAVGAGAGAIVGTVGVLLTRGHPVVIYPESILTFRLEAPVAVSTVRNPGVFRNVEEDAYATPSQAGNIAPRPRDGCGAYGCPPPNYYSYPFNYGFGWPSFYPYYFGPTFYFGRGGFYGYGRGGFRGFRR